MIHVHDKRLHYFSQHSLGTMGGSCSTAKLAPLSTYSSAQEESRSVSATTQHRIQPPVEPILQPDHPDFTPSVNAQNRYSIDDIYETGDQVRLIVLMDASHEIPLARSWYLWHSICIAPPEGSNQRFVGQGGDQKSPTHLLRYAKWTTSHLVDHTVGGPM